MTNQKPCAHSKNITTGSYEFKGLDDWFEVFTAGEHVSSNGSKRIWTHEELDSMVANHTAETSAPLVFGHPKTNDPAYGWTEGLKRDGDILLAKGKDVAPEFSAAVEKRHFPKRSIKVEPDGKGGFVLCHVGFLGAKRPAISGLKEIEFTADESTETYEFAIDDAVQSVGWRLGSIASIFRNFKNWFIAENGIEAADQMFPEYVLDDLNDSSAIIRSELKTDSQFSADDAGLITKDTPEEGPEMKTFNEQQLQDAVDAAVQKAVAPIQAENTQLKTDAEQAAFNGRLNDAKTLVTSLEKEGKLLPANSAGVAEFMANLAAEDSTFEFSAAEGEQAKTVSPYEFMSGFLKRLGKQIEFNKKHVTPEDALDKNDSVAIAKAAQEFVSAEAAAGREVSIANAVMHVTQTGADK